MIEIKECAYNDSLLIESMKWLSGSEEWQKEHGGPFLRNSKKKFFLLMDNGIFIGITAKRGRYISDTHILPEYRNKGYATYLTKAISKSGDYSSTNNPIRIHILKKLGFEYVRNKGKWQIWQKI